jgi:leader peptidase (prepilin peptidase)/N-methyltransferase
MLPLIYFIFGLVIGSFLNAAIYRLWVGKGIVMERSMCPHCKHELSPADLIPLFSFVFLRGRCRYCRKKISWQYPLVELFTGITFLLVGAKFAFAFSFVDFWFQLTFICLLILIAVYDFKHYLILDKIVFPAAALAVVYALIRSYSLGSFGIHSALIQGIIGIAIISGFFGLQFFISKGRWIGFGDVKFGLFLGMIFGLGMSLMLLFLSYCLGAIVGVLLIAMGKKDLGSKLPFGTFLGICGIIMILYGPRLVDYYLKLLGF